MFLNLCDEIGDESLQYISQCLLLQLLIKNVISIKDLFCANSIQHSTFPKISLVRRNVNTECEANPDTASVPERIMIRNNEVDFFIPGVHQIVAKLGEFKTIVVIIIKALQKQAAT